MLAAILDLALLGWEVVNLIGLFWAGNSDVIQGTGHNLA